MRFAFLTNTLLFAPKKRMFPHKIFSKNFQFLIARYIFSRFVDHCTCSVWRTYRIPLKKKKSKVSLSYISANGKRGGGYVCKWQWTKNAQFFSSLFPIGRLDFLSCASKIKKKKKKKKKGTNVGSFDRATISLEVRSIRSVYRVNNFCDKNWLINHCRTRNPLRFNVSAASDAIW